MIDKKFSWPNPDKFVSDHFVWLMGVAPFVLAAIDVLVVSGGDPEVFAYLLQHLAIVDLVLSVLLPLIPLGILLGLLWWLLNRLSIPKAQRTKLGFPATPFLFSLLGAALLTTTMTYLTGVLVLTALYGIELLFKHLKLPNYRLKYGQDFTFRPPTVQLSAFVLLFAFNISQALLSSSSAIWIPNEILHEKDESIISGQVLNSDHSWTIFRDFGNKVHIAKTDDIVSRQPCYRDTNFWGKTMGKLINEHLRGPADIKCSR